MNNEGNSGFRYLCAKDPPLQLLLKNVLRRASFQHYFAPIILPLILLLNLGSWRNSLIPYFLINAPSSKEAFCPRPA